MRRKQKGVALLEFALASLLLVPVTLGSLAIGLAMTKYLQVSSVCRSVGSMFVRGVDFSKPGMRAVLIKVADGINLGSGQTINPSGPSVVTVTQVMRVGNNHCAALPAGTYCTNRGKVVIVKQLRLGNDSLRASTLGSPSAAYRNSEGAYPATYYLTNSSSAVAAFGTATADNVAVPEAPVDLQAGETSYVAEVYFRTGSLNLFPQYINLEGLYSLNYF